MIRVGRRPWSWLLALPFCFGTAVACGQTADQDLGQFQGQGDFGTILHPGSGHYDASKDSYTVSGSGANLWFGIDDFHYIWRKMSGDVALSADIDFVGDQGNAHRKAVLMIRQSLDAHSVYADVARHGDGLTSLQYRDTIGADTHEIETYGKGPHRVRIEKRGDYAYVSIPDANGNMAPSGAAIRVSIQGDFYVGTAGDLVGLLDTLNVSSAVIVGHDWGATHAWNAALMRPDRFTAVFALSVPYVPRGDLSIFERMRNSGHEHDFYMFEQVRIDADQIWKDAAITIPGVLYWASGAAPVETRWSPMDPARSLHRPAPGPLPPWAEPDYVAHTIAEFQRTGFHGGLNYYRAVEPYFQLSGAWKGAKISQPSFYIAGKADGLRALYPPAQKLAAGLPGLIGYVEIDDVGHWVQHEASNEVSDQLVKFLRTVNAA